MVISSLYFGLRIKTHLIYSEDFVAKPHLFGNYFISLHRMIVYKLDTSLFSVFCTVVLWLHAHSKLKCSKLKHSFSVKASAKYLRLVFGSVSINYALYMWIYLVMKTNCQVCENHIVPKQLNQTIWSDFKKKWRKKCTP